MIMDTFKLLENNKSMSILWKKAGTTFGQRMRTLLVYHIAVGVFAVHHIWYGQQMLPATDLP
jgi:hypothetical protein